MSEEGSHKEWNSIWTDFKDEQSTDPRRNLFTTEEPTNIYAFWQKAYAIDLLELIKNKSYERFLELGSGRGTTTMYLANAGYEDLTMLDLAEDGFRIASQNFPQTGLKVPKMILADCTKTGLDADQYDCIYNIGLLEHFNDVNPCMSEVYRLLKNDGMVFMPIVPKMPFSQSLHYRLKYNPMSALKYYAKKVLKPGSMNSNPDMIRTEHKEDYYTKVCQEIGFKDVKCIHYNPYWLVDDHIEIEKSPSLKQYLKTYNQSRKEKHAPFLETTKNKALCYLLTATK